MIKKINELIFCRQFLFLLVILVAFVVFFHRLDEAPLSGDGIGYAQIAKEMTITGDYLTPYHDGITSFHTSKPPLLYWMMACSGKIFGFNNFSVKFPIALLALLSILVMFWFVRKYYDFNTAFFTSIILIFTQQYLHHARSCITDGPFATFFIIALVSFFVSVKENKSAFYYLMSFMIGLAIMTKQASGLLIYFVVFAYMIISRDFRSLKNIHFYLSFILVPIIVLPWHIAMYQKFGFKFIEEYFHSTINNIQGWGGGSPSAEKYTISISKYNFFNEWYIYLQLLVNNYWPWLPFLLYGFYKKFKNIKNIVVEKNSKDILVLCWALVPLIFFQIASKKNGNYLVPLYPAFALISAEVFANFNEKVVNKCIKIFVAISVIASILFIAFPIVPNGIDAQKLKDPIGLIDTVKQIDSTQKIVIRKEDWFVFSSMFLFYADRGNITITDDEFENEVKNTTGKYFATYKDDFGNKIIKEYNNNIEILKETKRTILFKN